jgi:hypothetical protein
MDALVDAASPPSGPTIAMRSAQPLSARKREGPSLIEIPIR